MASRSDSTMSIVVCGSGNSSHVMTGLVGSRKNTSLTILVLDQDESEEWAKSVKDNDFILSSLNSEMQMTDTKVKVRTVTGDPARALKKADMVIITTPIEQQQSYLEAIAPHVEANISIVGLPGCLGFEFQCYGILKTKAKRCCIINLNSQPCAGRIVEFGKSVKILSKEEMVTLSAIRGSSKNGRDPVQILQYIYGEVPELQVYNNFLESTFSSKCIIGPSLWYARWSKWDEKPLSKKPLFYKEITEDAAKILSDVSEEIVLTASEITKQNPKVDLANVVHIFDILKEEYKYNIEDDSSLFQAIKTNTAFDRFLQPVEEVSEGSFVPDYSHRFFTEDVPYGLVIIKGICQMVKVKTPVLDKVITWCQEKMGKEYICGSKLEGKDLNETRAPQVYGIKNLDDLVQMLS